jgi:hypothetical protein
MMTFMARPQTLDYFKLEITGATLSITPDRDALWLRRRHNARNECEFCAYLAARASPFDGGRGNCRNRIVRPAAFALRFRTGRTTLRVA